jgi:quercetin dioxygenase-like cupin family protein
MKKFAFIVLVLCGAFAMAANAQEGMKMSVTKIPPKVIFEKIINSGQLKDQKITVVYVRFAPGEVSGPHRHPIQTVAYVLSGKISSTFNGKTDTFKAGDTFYEEPNGLHSQTVNLSKTNEASLIVYYIGDKNQPFIMPAK